MSSIAGGARQADYLRGCLVEGGAAIGAETVEVEPHYEVDIEVEQGCQRGVDGIARKHELLPRGVGETDVGILEIEERGGVGAVVDRARGLHGERAADLLVGIRCHVEKHPALYALRRSDAQLGERRRVDIFGYRFLKLPGHIGRHRLRAADIDLHLAVEFRGESGRKRGHNECQCQQEPLHRRLRIWSRMSAATSRFDFRS